MFRLCIKIIVLTLFWTFITATPDSKFKIDIYGYPAKHCKTLKCDVDFKKIEIVVEDLSWTLIDDRHFEERSTRCVGNSNHRCVSNFRKIEQNDNNSEVYCVAKDSSGKEIAKSDIFFIQTNASHFICNPLPTDQTETSTSTTTKRPVRPRYQPPTTDVNQTQTTKTIQPETTTSTTAKPRHDLPTQLTTDVNQNQSATAIIPETTKTILPVTTVQSTTEKIQSTTDIQLNKVTIPQDGGVGTTQRIYKADLPVALIMSSVAVTVSVFNLLILILCLRKHKSQVGSKPSETTNKAPDEETPEPSEDPVYSYAHIPVLPYYETKKLVAANKKLGEESFTPSIPARRRGEFEYNYA